MSWESWSSLCLIHHSCLSHDHDQHTVYFIGAVINLSLPISPSPRKTYHNSGVKLRDSYTVSDNTITIIRPQDRNTSEKHWVKAMWTYCLFANLQRHDSVVQREGGVECNHSQNNTWETDTDECWFEGKMSTRSTTYLPTLNRSSTCPQMNHSEIDDRFQHPEVSVTIVAWSFSGFGTIILWSCKTNHTNAP